MKITLNPHFKSLMRNSLMCDIAYKRTVTYKNIAIINALAL